MKPTSPLMPSRLPKRAYFDAESIYLILDEALYCTISYAVNNQPFAIPTAFVRHDNKIYIHGSVGSHFIREIEKGIPVCITVALMDELVVAKAALSHSVNYRSVIIFAKAERIKDEVQKAATFKWLTEKIVPGSWDYLRPMTDSEVRRTTALAFDLAEASAKIRRGMPNHDLEDKALPIWSGLIPLQTRRGTPVADESSEQIALPPHLQG